MGKPVALEGGLEPVHAALGRPDPDRDQSVILVTLCPGSKSIRLARTAVKARDELAALGLDGGPRKPNNSNYPGHKGNKQKRTCPDQRGINQERRLHKIAHTPEAIYTALYAMPRGHLRASLLDLLRRRHKARRPARSKNKRRHPIPDMTLIDQRPVEVEMRLVPGHWEGDLIIGKGNLSQVGTLVERSTLFVALVKLPNGKADTVAESFTTIFNRFESQMRRSMTFDQGSEMRQHKTLTKNTGVAVYFAHPHAPWERGICENINGLLRQYLPKSTDLSSFSQQQLDDIAWKLNTRPRKTLGWKAPAELFLPKGAFDFVKYWSNIGNGVVPASAHPEGH
jgi:IS30 family transposase